MNLKNWKTYAFWVGISEAVGILAGILTRDGTIIYGMHAIKPPLSPPDFLFPIVWTILYALMGIVAARLYLAGRNRCINLFVAQLVVNFFWPLLFFNAQAYGFALIWLALLWFLVFALSQCARKTDVVSSFLLVPYLLWLTFALYLNGAVWLLN